MTTTLEFEITNSRWLTSNQRMSWQEKARRVRYLRELAAINARNTKRYNSPVHITATIAGRTRTRMDPANTYPTIKALIDGIVDARVIDDDDSEHVTGPDMRRGIPEPNLPIGAHMVTIMITEIGAIEEKP